ncbi:MAG: hypothetical protein FJ144_03575 [Deltaproteobacteria bacterium]|nr:hypothetical protein [Deltaproteobacteria bacterium]
MNWQAIVSSSGLLGDVAVIVALAVVLWRFRGDPTKAWSEYEARLRELQENLRLLVAQAEGEARALDKRLAAYAEQLDRAAEPYPPPEPRAREIRSSTTEAPLAERARRLVAARMPITEIARTLELSVAEARVLTGLAARAGDGHA